MASSSAAFGILLFSRWASASPGGVFANTASCKCLTNENGELKASDCTTSLANLTTSVGNQDFFTGGSVMMTGDWRQPLCIVAGGAIGDRAELKNCSDSETGISKNHTKLVHPNGLELKISEDDTLVLAEADDADEHLFEFHCSACMGDEGWSCGGPPPGPHPRPGAPSIQWMSKHRPCECLTVLDGELKAAPCDVTHTDPNQLWEKNPYLNTADGHYCVTLLDGSVTLQDCANVTYAEQATNNMGGQFHVGDSWLTIDDDSNLVFQPRMKVEDTNPQRWAWYPDSNPHQASPDCSSTLAVV